jgi:hypothetical protein
MYIALLEGKYDHSSEKSDISTALKGPNIDYSLMEKGFVGPAIKRDRLSE